MPLSNLQVIFLYCLHRPKFQNILYYSCRCDIIDIMVLEQSVWLPKYWFVMTTIATQYPLKPNEVTRKKYYELVQNLPLFMPQSDASKILLELLDKYPVTPYLDDREGFMKWVHFIKNKVNSSLGLNEQTTAEALQEYYNEYKPRSIVMRDVIKQREKYLYLAIIISFILGGMYLYSK